MLLVSFVYHINTTDRYIWIVYFINIYKRASKYLIERMSTNQEDNFIINRETVDRGMNTSLIINNKKQNNNNGDRNRNITPRWEYSHF